MGGTFLTAAVTDLPLLLMALISPTVKQPDSPLLKADAVDIFCDNVLFKHYLHSHILLFIIKSNNDNSCVIFLI